MSINSSGAAEKELLTKKNKNPEVVKRRTTGFKLPETDVRVIKRLLNPGKTRR